MNLDCELGDSLERREKVKGRLPVVVGCYSVPVTLRVSHRVHGLTSESTGIYQQNRISSGFSPSISLP